MMRLAVAVLGMAVLGGCCSDRIIRPAPEVVEIERRVLQPIPADVLAVHDVAQGPLSQCPAVASARKAALEECNGQIEAIRKMQESADE